jgi:hypothetical protein
VRVGHCSRDRFQNRIHVLENICVPEPQDAIPLRSQEGRPPAIRFHSDHIRVLASVYFDHKL